VDEGEILALLLVDAGEPRRRRTTGIHSGGQTLGRVAAARARGCLRGGEARPADGGRGGDGEGTP
jgi:hypothetical protein